MSTTKSDNGGSLQRMVRPMVCCSQCGGTGQTLLSPLMWKTLQAVRKLKEANAEAVMRETKWDGGHAAICNRLSHLMRLGLVERRGHRRNWMYRVVNRPNDPQLSHSRPTATPADTTRSGTATPPRNGQTGRLLAPAPC